MISAVVQSDFTVTVLILQSGDNVIMVIALMRRHTPASLPLSVAEFESYSQLGELLHYLPVI